MLRRVTGNADKVGDRDNTLDNTKNVVYVLIILAAILWLVGPLLGVDLDDKTSTAMDVAAHATHPDGWTRAQLVSVRDSYGPGSPTADPAEYDRLQAMINHYDTSNVDSNNSNAGGNRIVDEIRMVNDKVKESAIYVIDIFKIVVTISAIASVGVLRISLPRQH
ncbi:MAG: hypothetical protein F4W68_01680 [Cenarchaeum sp. SB0661_bin_35]|nr:hypothetical protein [Cenarchaeum sp. SB0667_bin_13]MXY37955.1 hypothetical protein [Cenarchaeum sp. SB0664_bin_35]MXZ93553.1 hypothetical protein [Cenarchaeum sp. SB0666_bin_15]MYB46710.1 hypothetical protein [Cenarchaeum sp. SB0662_bin_33]MYC79199.1 hypothetical protein [Cenarchaeum sp. SB0661_bin_35]MYD58522.1 hypothetical protein [Cenarchaeum sp. SB0678_bin_8]MYI51456.1 hypothetical protein [Cenarchaeum sp. SB0673_bin_9]MYJ27919.1 hypothetical protein [Cenarchaeum sp. SB0672_bin_9]